MKMLRSFEPDIKKTDIHKMLGPFAAFDNDDEEEKELQNTEFTRQCQKEFFNWGATFTYGDRCEFIPAIKIADQVAKTEDEEDDVNLDTRNYPEHVVNYELYQWTIMVRIHFPPAFSFDDHVLLESKDGSQTHFYFSNDFTKF